MPSRFIFLLVILLGVSGCLGPAKKLYPEKKQKRPVSVYVINLGWHTGIAFEGLYLTKKLPEDDRLPKADFLMIGWGDNKYYPSEKARIDLFLRAAFLPTGSVIHVVGFDGSVESYFASNDVVQIQISREGMDNMASYIAEQFHRTANRDLKYTADGLYPNSAFFDAEGLYFFPKTSNKWTARVLRKSGFPISPFYALTSSNVMRQVKKHGKVLHQ